MKPYPAAGGIGAKILAPSILSADFGRLKEQVAETVKGGAQFVHFDVMDGTFVKEISFGQPVLRSLRAETDLFIDVHLMVVHPETQVESFVKAGADGITFHLEAAEDPLGLLKRIHELGVRTGLSIKPATPVEAVYPYLSDVDMLLLMTVEPGAGGQPYIPESTDRIRQLKTYITENDISCDIEVDGGIRASNVHVPLEAGANVIVSGSAVYKGDIRKNTEEFMRLLQ